MTAEQITLVQSTFARVLPSADGFAAQFYERLFALDPALRPLFPSEMRAQYEKLLTMLVVLVRGLPRLELLLPLIEALGRRHAVYGATDSHYSAVGAALLDALEWELGTAWNAEVCAAWSATYALIADVMRTAAAAMAAELLD